MPNPPGPVQPKTILIIEDDPWIQEKLTVALMSAGYRVMNAYDGEAGLQSILTKAPNLVILDLVLPKKDGFKVLREMKRHEETKAISVVIFSNLENSDNIELAIRLGATSYLTKPNYTIANIVEKIQGILGDH